MPVGLANPAGELSPRISVGAPLSIGSLLYLGSIGLIAAGIVAVFFGAGFSLLVPTAGEPISGSTNRAGSEARSPLPSHGNVEQQTFFARASASENKEAALNSAAFPAPTEAPAIDGKDDVRHVDEVLASKAPPDTPVAPANAPVPAPNSPAAIALAPPTSGFSSAERAELLDHGDSLLRNGDVASARLFYERAAGAGDGRAALRLGATFDPEFLGRLGLGKMQANPAEARLWYSRARDLGEADAKRRLNSIETRQGK
jgi:TPR repeat protein